MFWVYICTKFMVLLSCPPISILDFPYAPPAIWLTLDDVAVDLPSSLPPVDEHLLLAWEGLSWVSLSWEVQPWWYWVDPVWAWWILFGSLVRTSWVPGPSTPLHPPSTQIRAKSSLEVVTWVDFSCVTCSSWTWNFGSVNYRHRSSFEVASRSTNQVD